MSTRFVAVMAAVVCLGFSGSAFAQAQDSERAGSADGTPSSGDNGNAASSNGNGNSNGTASGPMNSDEAAGQVHASQAPGNTPQTDPLHATLLQFDGSEISLGWRTWFMTIPSFVVGLFANIMPGWSGTAGIATGPELIYRNHGTDIVISAMYVDYNGPTMAIRGTSQDPVDTQLVTSYLYGLYLTASVLWGIHIAKVFEIQIGGAIGVGTIMGDLYRTQAYPTAGPNGAGSTWRDCVQVGGPPSAAVPAGYCADASDHHFSNSSYREPGIFNGGDIPTLIPWVSLPQISLHFRPARNLDIRLDGGFALIGFYGGGAIHFIF